MVSFYEPLVRIEDKNELVEFDKIALRLGLKGLAILGEKYTKKKVKRHELEHISRLEIAEEKVDVVRNKLPSTRLICELLSVRTTNDKVAQWVVKDNRVDILSIPISKMKEIITEQLANVAATNRTFFEIDLSPIFLSKSKNSINIRAVTRVMHVITKQNAPFIFTMNVSSPFDFRDRRAIISIAKLFGVSEKQFNDSYSLFNERIIQNRKKLAENFIAPGLGTVSKEEQKQEAQKNKKEYDFELQLDLVDLPTNEKRLERQRYVLFEILCEEEIVFEQKELERIFWDNFQLLFGSVGSSRLGLYFIIFDHIRKIGVVRCNHLALSALRVAFASLYDLKGKRIVINILKVAGTIKSIKKEKKEL